MAQNLAIELADIAVTRAVLLQQLGSSMSNEIKIAYLSILDDLRSKILKHETLDAVRVKQIIKEIKAITFPTLDLYDQLQEFSIDERDWLIASSNTAAGANIFRAIPPESVILAIGKNPVIEGALLKQWVSGLNDKMKFDFERSINLSMLQGESTQEASKRLTQVMGISMNQSETLARTAIADVSNRVREEVYNDNDDIIKGRRHVSTLDGRTSEICIARDGAEWDNNGKGLNQLGKANTFRRPPLHPRCRSYLEPILKSWSEIDPSLDWVNEIPETTRASMDGQIPSSVTFTDWLKNKDKKFVEDLLGKGRAELYLSGRISVWDLVTKGGRTRTLAELKAMK